MIYLKDGNMPLNLAYDDDIVQEANSTYQLSFKFPLTDGKWNLLKREVFLLADDLHGEQEFFIFEVKKANSYVQVYAKQVATLLNYYSINSISVDRVPGQTAMTALAGSIKRNCPFTFFSDIMDRHTFNESNVSVMDALVKDKHSIVGQWGGDLVRDKYQVKLLKNGGIENESLFMYKKNLSSYEESENINNLKTRLHLKKTIQGQSEGEKDRVIAVTVDSPLIGQYRQIYEADIEVNDQDVMDEATLTAYGQRYFSSTLCDLVENSINLDVKGKSDVSVKLFDTVSVFHERFDVDLRLKITSYHFGPMSKRLKSIGFGKVSQSVKSTVASMVVGSVDKATERLSASFEQKLQKEIDNANRHFDAEFEKRVEEINDGIEQSKAEAERYADAIKQEIATEINDLDTAMQSQAQEHDRQVADILSKTQSVESLANQAKTDAASALARANQVKTEAIADARAQVATVSQALNTAKTELQSAIASADQKARDSQASATALRNDLNLQASKILAQAQAQTTLTNRVTTVETLADGTKTTVAELSKTVSKATGDIASVTSRTKTVEDTLGQTRTQYEALTQSVNAQTGQIDSISRRTGTIEAGLTGIQERFESIKIGNRNYFKNAKDRSYLITNAVTQDFRTYIYEDFWKNTLRFERNKVRVSFDIAFSPALPQNFTTRVHFAATPWYSSSVTFKGNTTDVQHIDLIIDLSSSNASYWADNVFIRFSNSFPVNTNVSIKNMMLYISDFREDYAEPSEDFRSEFATYVRNATENSAELVRRIETADGKAVDAKSYAQQTAEGFKSRIESLETYKDAEGTRASQYLTASRTETAKQIAAERTAIATDYVAKSTYTEDVRGTTQKLNEIKNTADTAKQNLATYQETVDRKLTELTSSTQTLDGKINTASSKVDSVAGQIRTEISEVEGKIPTETSGNLLLNSGVGWSNVHDKTYVLGEKLLNGKVYTIASKYWHTSGSTGHSFNIGDRSRRMLTYNRVLDCWVCTFTINADVPKGTVVRIGSDPAAGLGSSNWVTLVKGSIALSQWQPAGEDLINELSSVKTTITNTARGVEQLSSEVLNVDDKITTAETKIRNLVNEVSSKVSQTDYNTLTGRVDSAETAITQNAQEISRRLTSTQVDKAITDKGYQTKAQVDNNITGRGYITNSALQPYALSTTVQTLVRETADSFSRTISETKALLPAEYSGNLIIGGNIAWKTRNYLSKEYQLAEKLEEGKTYTLVIQWWRSPGVSNNYVPMLYYSGSNLQLSAPSNSTHFQESPTSLKYDAKIDSWVVTFTVKSRNSMSTAQLSDFDKPNPTIRVYRYGSETANQNNNQSTAETAASFATLVKGNIPLSRWEPAYSELATVTALHDVEDTVSSHTRTIGAVGETGSILDNVSKVTQTANGLVTEVTGEGGLKTQVSQLKNSWAVKNLSSSGQIIQQINLSEEGFLVDAAKIRLKGKTLADEIKAIDGKFGTLFVADGTFSKLKSTVISAKTITGEHILFDKAFFDKMLADEALFKTIYSKNAFLTAVQAVTLSASKIQGGVLEAVNSAMKMDLNNANITFNQNATINFNSANNALVRRKGTHTAFVHFNDVMSSSDGGVGSLYASIGVTSSGDGIDSESSGRFAGLRAFRGARGLTHDATLDQLELYGDRVLLMDDFDLNRGFMFRPAALSRDDFIDMNQLVTCVRALRDMWAHYKNSNGTLSDLLNNRSNSSVNASWENMHSFK